LLLIAAAVIAVICIVELWPTSSSATTFNTSHILFGVRTTLNLDVNLMLVVILAGGLGGILHSLRSVAWYVGERQLLWSWMLFYAVLPIVGAIVALLFYLLIRGGLITPQGSSKDINAYGMAAIAALVGLFTSQAAQMLLRVFSNLFAPAPSGSDSAPAASNSAPAVAASAPAASVDQSSEST